MTQEQKAKAYDEALERAINAKQNTESAVTIGILEEIFPELKESEDEKIRKALIDYFNDAKKADVWCNGLHPDVILAWLEKQGKQKEYTFKSIPRLLDMIEPSDRAKAYCQKLMGSLQKEGYSTDAKIVGDVLKQMNGEKVALATMDEKQGEQKPAWSEEEEVKISRIVACLENLNVADNDILLEDVDWLKSLKERIGG